MNTSEQLGRYLAQRMASRKPMTKRAMLKRWPRLGGFANIDLAINWIEANTVISDNPFLFVWDRGEAVWGFRHSFGPVGLNLQWNLRYMVTRTTTIQKVLDHAIASPVVTLTPTELRAAKAVSAQMGGTIAFIESMAETLARVL